MKQQMTDKEKVSKLRQAVVVAANKFREYEKMHLDKISEHTSREDFAKISEKVDRNREMAKHLEKVLKETGHKNKF